MLNVECSNREFFSAFDFRTKKSKSPIVETKEFFEHLRRQREKQSAETIGECRRLQTLHKNDFERQFQSIDSSVKNFEKKIKPMSDNESILTTKKYVLPRRDYASSIYKAESRTFELRPDHDQNPIIQTLLEAIPDRSCSPLIIETKDNRSIRSPMKNSSQLRCPSVSTVASVDKRTHQVYEKWPDYNEISRIVGYRIEPPPSKQPASQTVSSRPSAMKNAAKRISMVKQVKNTTFRLSSSTTKNKRMSKMETTDKEVNPPVIIVEPKIKKEDNIPRLPGPFCPTSVLFSQRIQTRRWLLKTNFSEHSVRTVPLI